MFKNLLNLVSLGVAVFLVSGCAELPRQLPAPPLTLTHAEQTKLGVATEARLIQMLGGPYFDKSLAVDLTHLCLKKFKVADACKVSVADLSSAALYPLTAGQFIVTRGLLAKVASDTELDSLLEKGVALAGHSYENYATQGMNEAVGELLSNHASPYDPNAADIRLARIFKQMPCENDCLNSILGTEAGNAGFSNLPASVKRLKGLQAGYELLAEARAFEKKGDEAQAIATYLQAASETPDEPSLLRALGLAYLRAGQIQPARLHLQKAVELQPDYYRTRMGLGYLYLQIGQLQQANPLLVESAALLPVTENLFLLAEAREQSGDRAGALSLYRVIVEADPNSKLGRTSASRLAQSTGKQ